MGVGRAGGGGGGGLGGIHTWCAGCAIALITEFTFALEGVGRVNTHRIGMAIVWTESAFVNVGNYVGKQQEQDSAECVLLYTPFYGLFLFLRKKGVRWRRDYRLTATAVWLGYFVWNGTWGTEKRRVRQRLRVVVECIQKTYCVIHLGVYLAALSTNPPECSHGVWCRNGRDGCSEIPHDAIAQLVN